MKFREPANKTLLALASRVKRLVLLYRSFRLNQIEVMDPNLGLKIVYIGEGESFAYLRKTFFTGAGETKIAGLPIWLLRQKIKRLISSGSLVFVEVNRAFHSLIPSGGLLTFPWIRQKVLLKSNDYTEKKHRMETALARRIRKFDYHGHTTRDEKMVQKFYKDFYLPHISARFENVSHARTLQELKSAVRSGFLLQVFAKDLWVSGVVCRVTKNQISTLAFGHLPDHQYRLQWGALSAAYYFIFHWAEEHSIHQVDLLRSRANTHDGVYEHKRRWGAVPSADGWPHTSLWIWCPSVEKCLELKTQLIWNKNEFVEYQKVAPLIENQR